MYNLVLTYEKPDCTESRSILYETTELTGCKVLEVAYGIFTEVVMPTKVIETITFNNSNWSITSRKYKNGIESYKWINSKYSLGSLHWDPYESDRVWCDFVGTASIEVTYIADVPQQTLEYKTKEQGGEPYIKSSFYLYGDYWVRTSDFSKYNVGDWCLAEKKGAIHPPAGDPFAVYGAWDRYDSERGLWIKEIRRYYSTKPYDVLFTSGNVARIKPPSDNIVIIPKGI